MKMADKFVQGFYPYDVEKALMSEIAYLEMGISPKGDSVSSDPKSGIEFHQGKSLFGDMYLNHSSQYTSTPIKIAPSGSIVMSVRAPVGDVNIVDRNIAIGRGLCALWGKERLDTKFLYYWLNASSYEIKARSFGSTFDAINTTEIRTLRVPVPPLQIQREIVRILDNFTELTAELTVELAARQKQYQYYRDKLLTFKEKKT
ncbi:MAG: restriction endonuclease subunit S [Saccharofermentanales bacterium]|jgi:type I restriction enzyme S subunit